MQRTRSRGKCPKDKGGPANQTPNPIPPFQHLKPTARRFPPLAGEMSEGQRGPYQPNIQLPSQPITQNHSHPVIPAKAGASADGTSIQRGEVTGNVAQRTATRAKKAGYATGEREARQPSVLASRLESLRDTVTTTMSPREHRQAALRYAADGAERYRRATSANQLY